MSFAPLIDYLDNLKAPQIFWWRDDDTGNRGQELQQLLELRSSAAMPLVISAVPAWLDGNCRSLLAAEPGIFVAQHGFDHSDHSAAGEKSIELGGTKASQRVIERIRRGLECLNTGDIPNLLALMVPPWNRLSEPVLAALPALGFRSISTFAKDQRGIAFGLDHINCHIDPIFWRHGKRHMSETELALKTVEQLQLAGNDSNSNRPTGLLTHHLDMDHSAFSMMHDYLSIIAAHPNIDCHSPIDLFGRFS